MNHSILRNMRQHIKVDQTDKWTDGLCSMYMGSESCALPYQSEHFEHKLFLSLLIFKIVTDWPRTT